VVEVEEAVVEEEAAVEEAVVLLVLAAHGMWAQARAP
jgi:hypothetical protein